MAKDKELNTYLKEFYSLDDLAKELGLTPRTLRGIIASNELTASNIGKSYVIQRTDIIEWLERNKGTIKRK